MLAGRKKNKKKQENAAADEASAEVEDTTTAEDPEEGVEPAESTELEALRDEADKAAGYLDLAQRTAAELQNLQNRLAREKETARKLAVRDLMRALLPSIDNLHRALASADSQDADAVIEGVRLVDAEIHRILDERGLEVFDPTGRKMDPNLHEAVFSRFEEGVAEGTILETFEKGCRLGDLIVRPARVIVAAAPPTKAPAKDDGDRTSDAAETQEPEDPKEKERE